MDTSDVQTLASSLQVLYDKRLASRDLSFLTPSVQARWWTKWVVCQLEAEIPLRVVIADVADQTAHQLQVVRQQALLHLGP